MSHFFYKITAPAVVAGYIAWTAKQKAWDEQRKKLGQVFGRAKSWMYSSTRSYVVRGWRTHLPNSSIKDDGFRVFLSGRYRP